MVLVYLNGIARRTKLAFKLTVKLHYNKMPVCLILGIRQSGIEFAFLSASRGRKEGGRVSADQVIVVHSCACI